MKVLIFLTVIGTGCAGVAIVEPIPSPYEVLRATVDQVETGLRDGSLTERTKGFDQLSQSCSSARPHPVTSRSLVIDSSQSVFRYSQTRIVSHGYTETIHLYFDDRGRTIVALRQLSATHDRVVFNRGGSVLLSEASHDDARTWVPGNFDGDEYFARPTSASRAHQMFRNPDLHCDHG